MKIVTALLLASLTALAACSDSTPSKTTEPQAEALPISSIVPEVVPGAAPSMPEGSAPAAPELKFDENGEVIMPEIKAPAPPKPEGGPQAPELTPEMLEQAKAYLAEKATERQAESEEPASE